MAALTTGVTAIMLMGRVRVVVKYSDGRTQEWLGGRDWMVVIQDDYVQSILADSPVSDAEIDNIGDGLHAGLLREDCGIAAVFRDGLLVTRDVFPGIAPVYIWRAT